jgi:hypothetical protein
MVRMQRYRNPIQTVNLLIVSNDKGTYVTTVTGIVRLVACPVLSALAKLINRMATERLAQ